MKRIVVIIISFLIYYQINAQANTWISKSNDYTFSWDLNTDYARITVGRSKEEVWTGSVLPAFWLQLKNGSMTYLKPTVEKVENGVLSLQLGEYGKGMLILSNDEKTGFVSFKKLEVTWMDEIPAIIALYYGTSLMDEKQRSIASFLDYPFWPDWFAEGYCVPSAKGNPVQSFFRRWDFGNCTIPLGNFGESMGTPYAAAYPRPLLSASMGGSQGWIVFGAGSIPDAAMSLKVQSSQGCLQYLYREDLWGVGEKTRVWEEPLRITWAETAFDAYLNYFNTFEVESKEAHHQVSIWNTWGDWRRKDFEIEKTIDFAHESAPEIICFDDPWQTDFGSRDPNLTAFPNFDKDAKYVKELGHKLGLWMTVGWIGEPFAKGFANEDLLQGKDGKPRMASWTFSAKDNMYYCMDPSSEKTREYLAATTKEIVKKYGVDHIKMDFAYGYPSPDVTVPKNPKYRGERCGYELMKIIVAAAKEANPDITMQYYSIHPLLRDVIDLISLDDMGDCGIYEIEGHSQWSIWSALAGASGAAITGSTGYYWEAFPDVMMNTAIVGAPGSVMGRKLGNGEPVPAYYTSKFEALCKWHRRTTGWSPLWLNSEKGALDAPPKINCMGRLEQINGKQVLTALTLREEEKETLDKTAIKEADFTGNWSLISQDNKSIYETEKLACIAFSKGQLTITCDIKPNKVIKVSANEEMEHSNWKYENNRITIITDDNIMTAPICGYLVLR